MGRWTEEEEKILREEYPVTDTLILSKRLGRSVSAVENKASRMGLRKTEAGGDLCVGEPGREGFGNPFVLISREEALGLDKLELLRLNWSLALMYQRELNNPNLTQAERHKLMNALSNYTAIVNNIMEGSEELGEEEDDLESKFIEISGRERPTLVRARRVVINMRRDRYAFKRRDQDKAG